ncbi:HdeD family acid-resistance protein [Pseudoflavitalea rhizosphaerae]|uniref:HdeD family acid-resistance protein n=1 Tax=Pseudoflavitalea rhizosphaerae TaxID=1884793 RepID=UPI000F8CA709|nr:HdeD family acid-resistance protein [Pseudoflavitalea rhizosphaerae]
MNRFFSEYWWLFLLRGIFGVVLGLMALFMPGVTFTTLIIFLGAYLLIDGIFSIVAAINARKTLDAWVWYLVSGIFGVLVGIITFYNPFATALALLYLISFWVIVAGIIEIVIAIRLRKEIKGEGWYILGGLLTVIFGILILVNPIAGALTLTMIFGIYALIFGIMLIYLGIKLKQRKGQPVR